MALLEVEANMRGTSWDGDSPVSHAFASISKKSAGQGGKLGHNLGTCDD